MLKNKGVIAIIDLPKETFMPNTNIKTSIMIVKKVALKKHMIFLWLSQKIVDTMQRETLYPDVIRMAIIKMGKLEEVDIRKLWDTSSMIFLIS